MTTSKDLSKHPCFNKKVSGNYGRVHLPVAPKCNIKCNYCNRKYDCVNESRPGVTSKVLSPAQAVKYVDEVLAKEPRITVAGIAGPGDPFANALETLRTVRLLKEKHPHMIFCLSTNGLGLPEHLDELVELDVTHVTVTINAVDPEVGKNVYGWVRDGKVMYRGKQAAELLLERQLASVRGLKERGIIAKVNTIVMPGINDHHVQEVAAVLRDLEVDVMNMMGLIPNAGTPFANVPEPSKAMIRELRKTAGEKITQMTHCRRCRADAVGLLCKDRSKEFSETLTTCSNHVPTLDESRPYVAVATREGMLVNQHLGEAGSLQIWEKVGDSFRMVDERLAPRPGCGPKRWETLASILQDCRAVLCSSLGDSPRQILETKGVMSYTCTGFTETALEAVYATGDLSALQGRQKSLADSCCTGSGQGCS